MNGSTSSIHSISNGIFQWLIRSSRRALYVNMNMIVCIFFLTYLLSNGRGDVDKWIRDPFFKGSAGGERYVLLAGACFNSMMDTLRPDASDRPLSLSPPSSFLASFSFFMIVKHFLIQMRMPEWRNRPRIERFRRCWRMNTATSVKNPEKSLRKSAGKAQNDWNSPRIPG